MKLIFTFGTLLAVIFVSGCASMGNRGRSADGTYDSSGSSATTPSTPSGSNGSGIQGNSALGGI